MVRARKRFGQNFLNDPGIIERIIRAIDIQPGDKIIEIGPGTGALTQHIVKKSDDTTLIEIDRDLAATLKEQFPSAMLINEDVMQVEFDKLSSDTSVRVIGNLPYNISTPLLFKLFSYGTRIKDMYFMLQLEVVDRMVATHSTSSYGRLSIMTQLHCHVEKLFEVPPEAFTPRPKVRSAIVKLTPVTVPVDVDLDLLEKMLIHAFSARRKTIRNALKAYLDETALEKLALDPKLRPENLSVSDFVRCAQAAAVCK